LSYELLKNSGLGDKTLKLIRNHHQNAKRTGYPWVSNDFNADLNLQILSTADKYSALTEKRAYKESMTPKQALTVIYGDVKEGKLHPFVFKALVNYAENLSDTSIKQTI
jgi:HD-GYP domain-containing protein (c-di-GMP phosphodiesterase class II)